MSRFRWLPVATRCLLGLIQARARRGAFGGGRGRPGPGGRIDALVASFSAGFVDLRRLCVDVRSQQPGVRADRVGWLAGSWRRLEKPDRAVADMARSSMAGTVMAGLAASPAHGTGPQQDCSARCRAGRGRFRQRIRQSGEPASSRGAAAFLFRVGVGELARGCRLDVADDGFVVRAAGAVVGSGRRGWRGQEAFRIWRDLSWPMHPPDRGPGRRSGFRVSRSSSQALP